MQTSLLMKRLGNIIVWSIQVPQRKVVLSSACSKSNTHLHGNLINVNSTTIYTVRSRSTFPNLKISFHWTQEIYKVDYEGVEQEKPWTQNQHINWKGHDSISPCTCICKQWGRILKRSTCSSPSPFCMENMAHMHASSPARSNPMGLVPFQAPPVNIRTITKITSPALNFSSKLELYYYVNYFLY